MSLGGGAANRAERAAILEEASALAKSKGLAASKIPKNQILTDVAKYRGRHRYGVPTAVGGAAAVGTDILGRILQNYYARQNNAAPTPTPETAAK
jgi:hypothetical protein